MYQFDGSNQRLSFIHLADAEPSTLVNLIGSLHGVTQTSAKRRVDDTGGTTASIVLQSFQSSTPRPNDRGFIVRPASFSR